MDAEPAQSFKTIGEMVALGRRRLDKNVWDHVSTGAEAGVTLRRNRQSLDRIGFRPRVLRDVSKIDVTTSILGHPVRIPAFLAPVGATTYVHSQGGRGAAIAAAEFGTTKFVGIYEKPLADDLCAGGKTPFVYQLYIHGDRTWTRGAVNRIQDFGYSAICLTVDTPVFGRIERTLENRYWPPGLTDNVSHLSTDGYYSEAVSAKVTWSDVEALIKHARVPIILKGIQTAEDARLAVETGAAAVYVSTHGGRILDHTPGAIDLLPEIVDAIGRRSEIYVDSGFSRGSDVVKAIALGADAVGLGRLQLFSLAAAGAQGVRRMLEIMEEEINHVMALIGATRLTDLSPSCLTRVEAVDDGGLLSSFTYTDFDQAR